jgi:hypothetical protein
VEGEGNSANVVDENTQLRGCPLLATVLLHCVRFEFNYCEFRANKNFYGVYATAAGGAGALGGVGFYLAIHYVVLASIGPSFPACNGVLLLKANCAAGLFISRWSGDRYQMADRWYVIFYASIVGVLIVVGVFRDFIFSSFFLNTANRIHAAALKAHLISLMAQ